MAQANNNEVIQELEREILSLKDQYDSIAKHDHAKIVSIVRMMLQKSTEISVARGDIFSRACKACGEENPRVRFAAAECGHAMCSECAEGADTCPICDDPNPHFLRLFEDERGSRECGVCLFETPFVRSFFHCGHIVCLMCALNIACSADDENTSIQCPFCRESVNNVPTLVEERVKPDEAQAAFEDASNRKLQKKSKNKPTKIKRQKQKSCRVFNRVPLPRTS